MITGANTYTGATTVNAGPLVGERLDRLSAVTVNAGGMLGGTGMVGATTINGGTLCARQLDRHAHRAAATWC